jgi:hypothetical protein
MAAVFFIEFPWPANNFGQSLFHVSSSHLQRRAVSGRWTGEVTYGWGATYTEQFSFQAEGDKLFKTASFLAFKVSIEVGQVG